MPGLARGGFAMGNVVVVEQRGDLRVDDKNDVAAVAAITAVGAAQRLELLALNRGATVTAVAGRHVQNHAINECGH
jgi:hypothetical protein